MSFRRLTITTTTTIELPDERPTADYVRAACNWLSDNAPQGFQGAHVFNAGDVRVTIERGFTNAYDDALFGATVAPDGFMDTQFGDLHAATESADKVNAVYTAIEEGAKQATLL